MSWEPFGRRSEDEPAPSAPAPAPADREPATSGRSPAWLPREPARRLAVVTCMDSRIDPLRDLGLERGDAMVVRNGGATISDDVERSLRLAQGLGVEEVWIVGHSDCAALGGDEAAVKIELARGRARLNGVLPGISVRLLFFDFATGAAAPVEPGG
jgi:carbonic anhydrase